MESTVDAPDVRTAAIVKPPSYAEAIRAPATLPLPPYRPSDMRSRSPPPSYSEVIGQTGHQSEPNTQARAQRIRSAYQPIVANERGGRNRQSRSIPRVCRGQQSSHTMSAWRATDIRVAARSRSSDATENLLNQVRRPPGSLPHLHLLPAPSPSQEPRTQRHGFPTVSNKKVFHIVAGGLGLLIPLGVIIAMATREAPPEVETSTVPATPSVYYMDDIPLTDRALKSSEKLGLISVQDVELQAYRRKRRNI